MVILKPEIKHYLTFRCIFISYVQILPGISAFYYGFQNWIFSSSLFGNKERRILISFPCIQTLKWLQTKEKKILYFPLKKYFVHLVLYVINGYALNWKFLNYHILRENISKRVTIFCGKARHYTIASVLNLVADVPSTQVFFPLSFKSSIKLNKHYSTYHLGDNPTLNSQQRKAHDKPIQPATKT